MPSLKSRAQPTHGCERIEAFLVALVGDPWGAERPARIAIAEDRKHLDELMRTYPSAKDYET